MAQVWFKYNSSKSLSAIGILLLFLISCSKPREYYFENNDETSGGFLSVSMHLDSDGKLEIMRIEAKAKEINEAGSVFTFDTLLINGTWRELEDSILCKPDIPDPTFRKLCLPPGPGSQMATKGTLSFPLNTDTVFLFGQPCLRK